MLWYVRYIKTSPGRHYSGEINFLSMFIFMASSSTRLYKVSLPIWINWEILNYVVSKVILSSLKGDCSPMLVLWLKPCYNRLYTTQSHPPAMLTNWISFSLNLCFKTSNYFLTPEEAKRNESDLHKSWNLMIYDFTPTKGTQAWSTAIYQPFIC